VTVTLLILLLLLAQSARATSFAALDFDPGSDEEAIAGLVRSDPVLTRLDEAWARGYLRLRLSLPESASRNLKRGERDWYRLRTFGGRKDVESLKRVYRDNILLHRARLERLVPFEYAPEASPGEMEDGCGFGSRLPGDFSVYAAGWDPGRPLGFAIDASGQMAARHDIAVNSPDKPVALILAGSGPAIWNLGWTKGTRIAAVLAIGAQRQSVAGLPAGTPLLTSTLQNGAACGFPPSWGIDLSALDALSKKAFGKAVDLAYLAEGGFAAVGPPPAPGDRYSTSTDSPPVRDIAGPPRAFGPAALHEAVAAGRIRPAAFEDLEAWEARRSAAWRASHPGEDPLPPVHGRDDPDARRSRAPREAFVIVGPFRFPAGLSGIDYYLPEGAPRPEGYIGSSNLRDFATGTCRGPGCRNDR
jgi:hypothetical protein